MRHAMLFLLMLCLPGVASAGYIMSISAVPAEGTTVTGYSVYVRDQVAPKIVQVQIPDPPPSYPQTNEDGTPFVAPEWTQTYHLEDQLNPVPPQVYPDTFGQRIWRTPNIDHYSADLNRRAELWEDSTGGARWADIKGLFPELPGLMEAVARQWGEEQARAIASPYSEYEQKTWPYQREEAKRWEADHAAPTPYCDGLATTRGIPRETFIEKVRENIDLFEYYSKWIYGHQQALLDRIRGAATLAEIVDYADAIGLPLLEKARQLGGVTP